MKYGNHTATISNPRGSPIDVMAIGVMIAAAVLVTAWSTNGTATESADATARGVSRESDFTGLVELAGGRKMYLECSGSGSPTVVLISGMDTAADLWSKPDDPDPKVSPEVAKVTRVCAYDRPGAPTTQAEPSRSDDVPQPVYPEDGAIDLRALLQAADVPAPYVLVAHSYGGLIARIYAAAHPDEVLGMVLVDVLSPELRDEMTGEWWEAWKIANARPADAIAEYPPLERTEFDGALDQVRAAGSMRPMPLIVLSADALYGRDIEAQSKAGELPDGVPAELGYVIDSANKGAQQRLARLAPGAKHITDTNSAHMMMIDQPQLVIDAIVEVVDAVRNRRSTVVK